MSSTKLATFEELAATGGKRRFDEVTLPVCGLTVRIRSLFEGELSAYQVRVFSAKDEKTRAARLLAANRILIALCLVDGDGNPLVPDGESSKLGELDGADTACLYEACAKHVGIDTTDVEELVKNSETIPPCDSPTS